MSTPAAPPRRYFAWLIVAMCIGLAAYCYMHDYGIGLFYSLLFLAQITSHVMLRSAHIDVLLWLVLGLSIFVIPAIESTRDGFERAIRAHRMRQVLLGIFAYEKEHSQLPKLSIQTQAGKSLLSWRVRLLPYLGHDALYRQFNLNEPWSSPHNIALLPKMPLVYLPWHWRNPVGYTHLVALTGTGSVFTQPGVTSAMVEGADGRQHTAILAESANLIPWTKPEDEDFHPNLATPSLLAYPDSRAPSCI
jgi:hypothetical protein